jgi:hypothetical protein
MKSEYRIRKEVEEVVITAVALATVSVCVYGKGLLTKQKQDKL